MKESIPILIVDDYTTMLRIIRNLLRQLGHEEVDEAADGTAALEMMETKTYALVVADWSMQPVSGLDLLREVRSRPALADVPFIMITARERTDDVTTARAAGVSSCIVKPFNAEALRMGIQGVLGG